MATGPRAESTGLARWKPGRWWRPPHVLIFTRSLYFGGRLALLAFERPQDFGCEAANIPIFVLEHFVQGGNGILRPGPSLAGPAPCGVGPSRPCPEQFRVNGNGNLRLGADLLQGENNR